MIDDLPEKMASALSLALLYADDFAALVENDKQLRQSIKIIEAWCVNNEMVINK